MVLVQNRYTSFALPPAVEEIFAAAPEVTVAGTLEELVALSTRDAVQGWHEVAYDVPDRGRVVEAVVCRAKNGVVANYTEAYMRRRDPDCMVIGDERPTDKPTFEQRFERPFEPVRRRAFEWLKTQPLAAYPFYAGLPGKGTPAMVVAPDNAGFFALGLALLQGIIPPEKVPEDFEPRPSSTSSRRSAIPTSTASRSSSTTGPRPATSSSASTSTPGPAPRRASTACC